MIVIIIITITVRPIDKSMFPSDISQDQTQILTQTSNIISEPQLSGAATNKKRVSKKLPNTNSVAIRKRPRKNAGQNRSQFPD